MAQKACCGAYCWWRWLARPARLRAWPHNGLLAVHAIRFSCTCMRCLAQARPRPHRSLHRSHEPASRHGFWEVLGRALALGRCCAALFLSLASGLEHRTVCAHRTCIASMGSLSPAHGRAWLRASEQRSRQNFSFGHKEARKRASGHLKRTDSVLLVPVRLRCAALRAKQATPAHLLHSVSWPSLVHVLHVLLQHTERTKLAKREGQRGGPG